MKYIKINNIKFTENDLLIQSKNRPARVRIMPDNTINVLKYSGDTSNTYYQCSCTGKTKKTATKIEYDDGIFKCPKCGSIKNDKIKVLKTADELITEAKEKEEKHKKEMEESKKENRANLHLEEIGWSLSSGIHYYALSTTIDYDDWKIVKDLFFYNRYNAEDEEFDCIGDISGWVTRNPEEVEKRLVEAGLIKPENTLQALKERKELERIEQEKTKEKRTKIKEQIDKAFENAEKPEGENIVKGESIEDPKYPINIYGGGHEYVIQKEEGYIWDIHNNGSDGADWSLNNVATGGAGAIGYRVKYTEELEDLIRSYVNSFWRI